MTSEHRAAIQGETDSEHIFHMILSMHEAMPARSLLETLRASLVQIVAWSEEIDPAARLGLNVLLTEGTRLVGSRWGRTLERSGHRHRRRRQSTPRGDPTND
jgi:glutamine amidotransferase